MSQLSSLLPRKWAHYLALFALSAMGLACRRNDAALSTSAASTYGDLPELLSKTLDGPCLSLPDSTSFASRYETLLPDGSKSLLTQLRTEHQVVTRRDPEAILDHWFSDAKDVQFRRSFLKHQRRIDYETGDLKALGAYAPLSEQALLVAPELDKQLDAAKPIQYRCQEATLRRFGNAKTQVIVIRLQGGTLAALFRKSGESSELLSLESFVSSQTVQSWVTRSDQFESTDFADVGDNEADPFLAQMIHQGFVVMPGHASHAHQTEEKTASLPSKHAVLGQHSH